MLGLFSTIFGEGYVDRKRYSCNSLGNQKRQSALIFELYEVKGPCCSMSICVITISHFVSKSFEQLRNSIKLIVFFRYCRKLQIQIVFEYVKRKFCCLGVSMKLKCQGMRFSFLILLFSEGYVDHKRYPCNSLGKQIRQPGQNCERVPGEMSMLFNADLCYHNQPFCV